ncbi:MAG: hypothetical protein CMK09_18525 [Ponticaulis sp.]|nr:hypothetical protein [Ponticaulis sp.]|tara:strand:+ start:79821 stop:80483 length:663 start_codon:yes stop_codon:yes gene_type:complete
MTLTLSFVYGLSALFLSAQSAGDEIRAEEIRKLKTCLELIETDPEAAYEMSLAWLYEGNRPGARECKASAMIALGYYEDGALQLEALANAPDAGSTQTRAFHWSKAGNAWLQGGFPDEAILAFDNAFKLDSEDFNRYTYRAQAYLMTEDWERAEADLDISISNQPGDLAAYMLRATARSEQGRYDAALQDIDQAMAIEPENIDVLVLRGDIREAKRLSEE